MQVPLYMFNPTYTYKSFAANADRVQSAMLQITSATSNDYVNIRNISARENSQGYVLLDGNFALDLSADMINKNQGEYWLQVRSACTRTVVSENVGDSQPALPA